jgi:cation transport regulator ChaB
MPKTTKGGDARKDELPGTIERSDPKAQRTFAKAHDAAAEEYGDAERAHRVAYSALKHTHEKVGDHWQPKDSNGPSDDRAAGGPDSRAETAGGVDARASKKHLQEVARELDVPGRSTMTKDELVEAIGKANDRASARARRKG